MKKLLFLALLLAPACFSQTIVPVTSGTATINATTAGSSVKIPLTAAATVTITGQPSASAILTILFSQDSTGRAVTFDTAVFRNAPTIPTAASTYTAVTFQYDGNTNYWYGTGGPGTSGTSKVELCGTTTTCAKTVQQAPIIVYGTVALTSASPSTATLTALPFTTTASYVCTANDVTAVSALGVANASASSTVITGPNTVTDTVNYVCVGT